MDVNAISNSTIQAQNLNSARAAYSNVANNPPQPPAEEETPSIGEAFEVEISAEARQAAAETALSEEDIATVRTNINNLFAAERANQASTVENPEPETVEEVIEEKVEEATTPSTTTTTEATTASATSTANATSTATASATTQATATTATNNATQTKGLTADQIRSLEQSLAMSQQSMLNMMIQVLQDQNNKLQGWLDSGTGILNFGGTQVDASRFALPEVATNPEDAAKAVGEGGDWSVEAVSDRIFGLAETLAGGDPEKLQQMRDAVEEGFKQAGSAWTNATGLNDMPDITSQTHDNIMKRFEDRMKELQSSGLA